LNDSLNALKSIIDERNEAERLKKLGLAPP